jgi:hypothetical protein
MDERKTERELFGNHWAMPTRSYRRPSRFERLQAGRRQWFVGWR